MFSLEELFCTVDDFCQAFEPSWRKRLLKAGLHTRERARQLSLSASMTVMIAFHQQRYRTFKDYDTKHVCCYWQTAFPALVSDQRFVSWMPSAVLPLCAYLRSCFGKCSGISFIDSTSLKVCHNRRIQQHKVFANLAARGKTSVVHLRWGEALWFFGFKLHLVVNDKGDLLNVTLTPGSTVRVACAKHLDRTPVPQLLQRLFGRIFGDKG